ncbi:hypothetical protein C8Q74DRAFT_806709 [Fomes fomentarius]|nr:hypothetical protein C8Q74DRAFT_806709 [Fomes fomentarius]
MRNTDGQLMRVCNHAAVMLSTHTSSVDDPEHAWGSAVEVHQLCSERDEHRVDRVCRRCGRIRCILEVGQDIRPARRLDDTITEPSLLVRRESVEVRQHFISVVARRDILKAGVQGEGLGTGHVAWCRCRGVSLDSRWEQVESCRADSMLEPAGQFIPHLVMVIRVGQRGRLPVNDFGMADLMLYAARASVGAFSRCHEGARVSRGACSGGLGTSRFDSRLTVE